MIKDLPYSSGKYTQCTVIYINGKESVQFSSADPILSSSLRSYGLQHARLSCLSPSPRACSNSCPSSCDAIQPFHSLSSPSSSAFNLSQHQGLFQWVSSSHQVAKVLEFQLQHQCFQWIFRTGLGILDWVAMPSSRESFWPRDQTYISYVSCIGRPVLYHWCHLIAILNFKKPNTSIFSFEFSVLCVLFGKLTLPDTGISGIFLFCLGIYNI